MTKPEIIINAESLKKYYERGKEEVRALDGIDLKINTGEILAITGPSGSGKTTLLNLLSGFTTPTAGELMIAGTDLHSCKEKKLAPFRRETIGFVFQQFQLIPTLTALENVLLPTLFSGKKKMEGRAHQLLSQVGLEGREKHLPSQLSGGEMQRVAVARALINSPKILLADEPTGNLDSSTGRKIIELFETLNDEGLTIIVVTHDSGIASSCKRTVKLKDGKLED